MFGINWESADLWFGAQIVCSTAALLAAGAQFFADFTSLLSDKEIKRRWDRNSALVIMVSALVGIGATVQANNISDADTERLKNGTATALHKAGVLGVHVDNLQHFVDKKTGETDNAISALKTATKRAENALPKVDVLDSKERKLAAAQESASKRLSELHDELDRTGNQLTGLRDKTVDLMNTQEALVGQTLHRKVPHLGFDKLPPVPVAIMVGSGTDSADVADDIEEQAKGRNWTVSRVPYFGERERDGVEILFNLLFVTTGPKAGSVQAEKDAILICAALNAGNVAAFTSEQWPLDFDHETQQPVPAGGILIRIEEKPTPFEETTKTLKFRSGMHSAQFPQC